jgi:hypothetical protein
MKVIVAGSRHINDYPAICLAIGASGFEITELVSGGANGVDHLGEQWAKKRGIRIKVFPAEWEKYGRSAGPRRNEQMALYADALILVWDGKSTGSRNMLYLAKARRLKIVVFLYVPGGKLKRLEN